MIVERRQTNKAMMPQSSKGQSGIQHAIISPQYRPKTIFAVFKFWLISPLHSFVNCWSFLLWFQDKFGFFLAWF